MKVLTTASVAFGWNCCSAGYTVASKLNVVYVELGVISYATMKDGANVFRVLNAVYGNYEI